MTALELRSVGKRYKNTAALTDYSLTVPAGQVTAFVGPNGAGKSTAMRLLGGLREPDTGEVVMDGRRMAAGDRARIGHMPEERGLYLDEPVRAQVRYFARLIGIAPRSVNEHVDVLLERVGVAELSERRFAALSLGNRQRAQLALALLGHPRYLLLDEPFSGLDVEGLAQVSEVVRSLASDGVGVLVSSHQLEVVASICDRVAVIARGRSMIEGPLSDVVGTAVRSLRLTFRVEGAAGEAERNVQEFAAASGGVHRRDVDTLVLEVPVEPGRGVDPGILASAVTLAPLASIDVTRPSLRELLGETA